MEVYPLAISHSYGKSQLFNGKIHYFYVSLPEGTHHCLIMFNLNVTLLRYAVLNGKLVSE